MIVKNIVAVQQEEKKLRTEFFRKTDGVISHILTNIPSDTILMVEDKELKVIYAANDRKSLLIDKKPLTTFDDYEWIVENIPGIVGSIAELEQLQIDEIRTMIDKTRKAIEKVEILQAELDSAP